MGAFDDLIPGAQQDGFSDLVPTAKKQGFFRGVGAGAVSLAGTVPAIYGGLTGVTPEQGRTGARGAAIAADELASEIYQGPTFEDVKADPFSSKTLEFIKGSFGQLVAPAVATIGLAATGARLGAPVGAAIGAPFGGVGAGPGAVIGGAIGAIGATALPFFGFNLNRQTQEQEAAIKRGEAPKEYEVGQAAAVAPIQAALDRFALGKVLKGTKLGTILGEAGDLTTKQAQEIAGQGLLKTVGKGVLRAQAAELPTEIAQQALERAQAGLDVTSADALKEYEATAAQVIAGVAPLGGGAAVVQRSNARARATAAQLGEALATSPLKEEITKATAEASVALNPEAAINPQGASTAPTAGTQPTPEQAAQITVDAEAYRAGLVPGADNISPEEQAARTFVQGEQEATAGLVAVDAAKAGLTEAQRALAPALDTSISTTSIQTLLAEAQQVTGSRAPPSFVQNAVKAVLAGKTREAQVAGIAALTPAKNAGSAVKAAHQDIQTFLLERIAPVPVAAPVTPVAAAGSAPAAPAVPAAPTDSGPQGALPAAELGTNIPAQLIQASVAPVTPVLEPNIPVQPLPAPVVALNPKKAKLAKPPAAQSPLGQNVTNTTNFEEQIAVLEARLDSFPTESEERTIKSAIRALTLRQERANKTSKVTKAELNEVDAISDAESVLGTNLRDGLLGKAGGAPATPSHTLVAARALVKNITSKWKNKPKVTVSDIADVSAEERAWFAKNGTKAYFNQTSGEIVIISDLHSDLADVKASLFHEALGHYGLQAQFRSDLDGVLVTMYEGNADLRTLADNQIKANPDYTNAQAMEEVLANSQEAGKLPQNIWGRLVALVRNFLRQFGAVSSYTVNDAIAVLREAHDIVVSGKPTEFIPGGTELRGKSLDVNAGPGQAINAVNGVLGAAFNRADNVLVPLGLDKPISNVVFKAYLRWSQFSHLVDIAKFIHPKFGAAMEEVSKQQSKAAATALDISHDATRVADSIRTLVKNPKHETALEELIGVAQRDRIFPNIPLVEHYWLAPDGKTNSYAPSAQDKQRYAKAQQSYRIVEVAKVYDAMAKEGKRWQKGGEIAVLKTQAQLHGVDPKLWRALDLRDDPTNAATAAKVQAIHEWVNTNGSEDTKAQFRASAAYTEGVKIGNYFSNARFGDWAVDGYLNNTPEARAAFNTGMAGINLKDRPILPEDTPHIFVMFETEAAMNSVEQVFAKLKKDGHLDDKKPYTAGAIVQKLRELDSSAPTFIRNMLVKIDDSPSLTAPEKQETKELLRRMYITMLPEANNAKHYQRRNWVAGWSGDAARSFAARGNSASFFIAQNLTRPEQNVARAEMKRLISDTGDSGNPEYNTETNSRLVDIMNQVNKHTANTLTPVHTPKLDIVSAVGHSYYLALSPGYIAQNAAQPWVVGLPLLGARHGYVNSVTAMTRAGIDAGRILSDTIRSGKAAGGFLGVLDAKLLLTKAVERGDLTVQDSAALQVAIDAGTLDFTRTRELTQLAEGTDTRVSTTVKAANYITYLGETLNRMQMVLSSSRLERERGIKRANQSGLDTKNADVLAGIEEATQQYMISAVRDSQFDYSPANRSEALGKKGVLGAFSPLVLQFQQYGLSTMQLFAKLTLRAVEGGTDGERVEAVKAIAGLITAAGVSAGVLGLPFAGVFIGAYNAFAGDEDEPKDAKGDFLAFWESIVGEDLAQAIAHGPVDYITGATVSNKLGQGDIVPFTRPIANLLDSRKQLRDRLDAGALEFLGPAASAIANISLGASRVLDGDWEKGLEKALPTALKGPLKAYAIADDGFTDASGNALPLEATGWDSFVQASGFVPTKKSIQGEAQAAVSAKRNALRDRASALAVQFAKANESTDPGTRAEGIKRVLEDIREFRGKNPTIGVDVGGAIRRRARDRAIREASPDGVR